MNRCLSLLYVAAILCPLRLCGEDALNLALRALKMTQRDLAFSKTNAESGLVQPVALVALQEPLILPGFANDVMKHVAGVTNLAGLEKTVIAAKSPSTLMEAVGNICAAVSALPGLKPHRAAYEAFALGIYRTPKDKALLDPELVRRDEALEFGDDELAQRILRPHVDRTELTAAYARLLQAVDGLLSVRDISGMTDTTLEFPEGTVIIGGPGPNVYTNEALLIIDVGGDDIYENSAGGADGMAGRPVSIVIDLAGNDRYVSRRPIAQGAGVFGIGILVDVTGDDVYEATHFSQGAGFYGCGLLADFGGWDTFKAGAFSQGAGAFGCGTLWQRGGDSSYRASEMTQGFAATEGHGLLLDAGGNDTYVAGGEHACSWLPGHHFSLAQGFGYGMRPFAGGGVGILADLAGDDRYQADVYGQGASYWYAVGLLLDASGNDTYDVYQYGQGGGIHLSSGALVDWNGNDRYTSHGISQGGAHDYAVGMLIDHAGNDIYRADSTAQGGAINNSFALLVDRAGNDRYTGTDTNLTQASGHDGGRREYGSIGLMLDLAGKDTYSQGQRNNAMWVKPLYGAGLDAEWPGGVVCQTVPEPPAVRSSSLSSPYRHIDVHHPTERLLRRAGREPDTEHHKKDADEAWEKLKRLGAQALPYLLSRLDSPDVMVRVKTEEMIDHLGTNAVLALLAEIETTRNDDVARQCCYFLARFESATNAVPVILPLLQREKTRATALYTLGHLRARQAYEPAVASLHDGREIVRLRAAQALGRIGNRQAIPALVVALDDEFWPVRYAAEDALVAMGRRAIPPLRIAHRRASASAQRHLVGALLKLGDPGALALARVDWRNENPLVRAAWERQARG